MAEVDPEQRAALRRHDPLALVRIGLQQLVGGRPARVLGRGVLLEMPGAEQPAAAALDRAAPLLPGMVGVKRPSRVSGWPLLRPPLGAMMARRSPVCFGSSPDKALCEAVKRQDRCDRSSPNQVVSSGETTLLRATSGRCRTRPGVEWDSRYLAPTYGLNRAHANV